MSVIDLSPASLVTRRDTVVFDIRAAYERDGDLGFIPGSRWVPEPVAVEAFARLDGRTPVLACLSGRRSAELAKQLAPVLGNVGNLVGGLLGWGAAGLPVCHRPTAPSGAPPRDMDELRKRLRSCFVVEAVESSAGDDAARAQRAMEVVHQAFPDARLLSRGELERRIDRLAEVAWAHGHRLESIAKNTEHFYAVVASL